MFALASRSDPSLSSKLAEIDVANENQHSPTRHHHHVVSHFRASHAYRETMNFLQRLNSSVEGIKVSQAQSEAEKAPVPAVQALISLLDRIEALVDRFPPIGLNSNHNSNSSNSSTISSSSNSNSSGSSSSTVSSSRIGTESTSSASSSASSSRFGNVAFRSVMEEVQKNSEEWVEEIVGKYGKWEALPVIQKKRTTDERAAAETTSAVSDSTSSSLSSPSPPLPPPHVHPPHASIHPKVLESLRKNHPEQFAALHHHSDSTPSSSSSSSSSSFSSSSSSSAPVLSSSSHPSSPPSHSSDFDLSLSSPPSSFEDKKARVIREVTKYLLHAFGDMRRIDYGTGHELNFVCFLYAMVCVGVFDTHTQDTQSSSSISITGSSSSSSCSSPPPSSVTPTSAPTLSPSFIVSSLSSSALSQLVLLVFRRYISVMRRLQTVYWLEPAGSRGVWGLDDYCFLPFVFGSSQLFSHPHIKPKSVRSLDVVDGFRQEYLYLDSISFINRVKTCSFAEHSPMLNDITAIKSWDQVNRGLLKMYDGEVLKKHAVVQHFIYTEFLRDELVTKVEQEKGEEKEDLCCSDVIHFPSALAAKKQED